MKQRGFILLVMVILFPPAARAADAEKIFLLHLPGVGGHLRIDDLLVEGLRQGRLNAEVQIFDWTAGDPGLGALGGLQRNLAQAQRIADRIVQIHRADPNRRIILTSHSGGTGLAVWALERLPDDVRVDTLVMLASALSPQYDLSRALKRVRGPVYAFNSPLDPVLDLGTRTFGTIDRIKSVSAGLVGFTAPRNADQAQYRKLLQFPYDAAWLALGNAGDHIGTMNVEFARQILAPLLLEGRLVRLAPATQPHPATQPLERLRPAAR